MLGRDRDADDRQDRLGRQHPGEVRRAAGAGDDDPDPATGRLLGVAEEPVRRAMRRDDLELGGDTELVEDGDRRLERREVRAAAADDADDGAVPTGALAHRSTSFVASSAQWSAASAPRAFASALSTSVPSAVRCPILRRSKTWRLS